MSMIKSFALLFTGIVASALPANADGPFGVEMGAALDSFASCEKFDRNTVKCKQMPKMHRSFDLYTIIGTEDTGACVVTAISPAIDSGAYGVELKNATDKIADQLAGVYGKATKFDFVMNGSIWREEKYWMMANHKKDRAYAYFWTKDNGFKSKNNVSSIGLEAKSAGNDYGFITLRYDLNNSQQCIKLMKGAEASAL